MILNSKEFYILVVNLTLHCRNRNFSIYEAFNIPCEI